MYRRLCWWASKQRAFEWLFLLFRDRYVTRKSDLVIEGYPRSGNSFARWAFITAQKRPVEVADHFHSIGHIQRGIRLKKPVLVLVRSPEDAVSSFLVHQQGNYSVRRALIEYIQFYTYTCRQSGSVVVATFDQVTTDFGAVIDRVNRRFGTRFESFLHTEENVARCFEIMEERNRKRMSSQTRICRISRPVPSREGLKDAMMQDVMSNSYAGLLQEARTVYQRAVQCAV